jgi:hypothetical protein
MCVPDEIDRVSQRVLETKERPARLALVVMSSKRLHAMKEQT